MFFFHQPPELKKPNHKNYKTFLNRSNPKVLQLVRPMHNSFPPLRVFQKNNTPLLVLCDGIAAMQFTNKRTEAIPKYYSW
jgi:hypothetical protein